MINILELLKKYLDFKSSHNISGKDMANLEPETIVHELDLPVNLLYTNAIGAINALFGLKQVDDYIAFEKITMALNYKNIDTQVEQDPNLPEVFLACVISKKITNLGLEVTKWVASKFIYENLFVCPEGFEDIQYEINRYLNINYKEILMKVHKIKNSKIEDWKEGSMERTQLEKIEECEKYITEEKMKEVK